MKRFLWDNHFAAVASDMPSLEVCLAHFQVTRCRADRTATLATYTVQRWPPPEGITHLHSTMLGYAFATFSVRSREH